MTIKDKHRKSSIGFQVLLVQAKLLVRVPEKISLDFCTFAIAFFAFLPYLSHALDHTLVQIWHLLPEIPGKRMLKYLILLRIQSPMIAAIPETTFKNALLSRKQNPVSIITTQSPCTEGSPKFSPGKNASKVANVFLSSVSCVSYPVIIELLEEALF